MRSARRRARELALQGLYQWQLTGASAGEIGRDLADVEGHSSADADFLGAELEGVIGEAKGLQALLEPLADRKWAEVSPVEKAILLIGAWEIAHLPQVPYRVAINEAIELAKRFGGTDGHKYVNGILDKVAQALRPEEVAAARSPGRESPREAGGRSRPASRRQARS